MNLFNVLATGDCSAGYGYCCSDPGLASILSVTHRIIQLIQIIVPIILMIFVMIGIVRMMINPEDKKGMKSIFNKIMAAFFIFMMPTTIDIAMGMMPDSIDFTNCWKAADEMNEKIQESTYTTYELTPEEEKNVKMYIPRKGNPQGGGGAGISGDGSIGSAVIQDAVTYVGKIPYIWGGTDLNSGVDCSGFIQQLYRKHNIYLPRTSGEQAKVGTAISGIENARAGDILCYNGHVALYMGDGRMVHAANSSRGLVIDSVRTNGLLTIRRVA